MLTLHSDNGGEFDNRRINDTCKINNIEQWFTLPYSPEENPAERRIGTLLSSMRTLLYQSNLPDAFWPEAMATAIAHMNRNALSQELSPLEIINMCLPSHLQNKDRISRQLRPFGCLCYVWTRKQDRSKLNPTSKHGVYLGPTRRGFNVLMLDENRIVETRQVRFVPDHFSGLFSNMNLPIISYDWINEIPINSQIELKQDIPDNQLPARPAQLPSRENNEIEDALMLPV